MANDPIDTEALMQRWDAEDESLGEEVRAVGEQEQSALWREKIGAMTGRTVAQSIPAFDPATGREVLKSIVKLPTKDLGIAIWDATRNVAELALDAGAALADAQFQQYGPLGEAAGSEAAQKVGTMYREQKAADSTKGAGALRDLQERQGMDVPPNLADPMSIDLKDIWPEGVAALDKTREWMGRGDNAFDVMAQKVFQFAGPFSALLKVMGGIEKAGTVAAWAQNIGKIGLADALTSYAIFDPHEARFADLLKEFGPEDNRLVNAYVDFAMSDLADTDAEGRFKNAVDAFSIGVPLFMADAVFQGGKAIVRNRQTIVDRLLESGPGMGTPASQRGSVGVEPEQGQPFFSALGRAIETSPLVKASPEQWVNTLRNTPGIKPEELDWYDIGSAFSGSKSVTRKEVQEYLRAHELEVQEVVLGEPNPALETLQRAGMEARLRHHDLTQDIMQQPEVQAMSAVDRANLFGWVTDARSNTRLFASEYRTHAIAQLERLNLSPELTAKLAQVSEVSDEITALAEQMSVARGSGSPETMFDKWQLPGGENYRELLLTLPDEGGKALATGKAAPSGGFPQNFTGGHFDQPNVLAHVRFNERTDQAGAKVLFIEEIQSDWHQKGRRQGYASPRIAELTKQIEALGLTRENASIKTIEAAGGPPHLATEWFTEVIQKGGDVPNAPFKTTWPELAVKRMVRWAAENDFDRIAWTTGEQQAARYDLSKHIDQLIVRKAGDGSVFTIEGNKGQSTIIAKKGVKPEELDAIIGKDLADKARAQDGGTHVYNGVDLKIGGEGQKGFYDKIIPAAASKIGKKYGAKVETIEVDTGVEPARSEWVKRGLPPAKESVNSLPITPALKKAALAGQPLFAIGGGAALVPGQQSEPQLEAP